MSRLLAVDPSLTCTGWAVFDDGKLTACGVVETTPDAPLARRVAAAGKVLAMQSVGVSVLVVETPQVYRHTQGKGEDPNDLIAVAMVAGGVLTSVAAAEKHTPRPAEWKGQVPKEIHNARVLKRLTTPERAELDLHAFPARKLHNAIDAIGIGLWYLGRMGAVARDAEETRKRARAG